jgi:hypothetical protein
MGFEGSLLCSQQPSKAPSTISKHANLLRWTVVSPCPTTKLVTATWISQDPAKSRIQWSNSLLAAVASISIILIGSRGSSVGIRTGYMLHIRSSIPGKGKEFVSTPRRLDLTWGPIQRVSGALSPEIKRPEREAISPLPHTSSWRDD